MRRKVRVRRKNKTKQQIKVSETDSGPGESSGLRRGNLGDGRPAITGIGDVGEYVWLELGVGAVPEDLWNEGAEMSVSVVC